MQMEEQVLGRWQGDASLWGWQCHISLMTVTLTPRRKSREGPRVSVLWLVSLTWGPLRF